MNTDINRAEAPADIDRRELGDDHESEGGAAAIGRELDTLLAIIQMNAQVGLETGPPELSDLFGDLMIACRRGAEISQRLARSNVPRISARRTVDMVDFVEELAPIVQELVGPAIECELREALTSSPIVLAERDELERLVLEIAADARRVMPNGGKLRLTLADESIGRVRLRFELLEPSALLATNGLLGTERASIDSSVAVAAARRLLEHWGATLHTGAEPAPGAWTAPSVALVFLRVAHRSSRPPVIVSSDRIPGVVATSGARPPLLASEDESWRDVAPSSSAL